MRYVFVLSALLVACAAPQPIYTRYGKEVSYEEFQRAVAECEREVGGQNKNAVDVCRRDKGYRWFGT